MTEPIDQLARRLLGKVLDGDLKWTPDMRLRIATVAQAYASLAIVDELRRLNDGRDQFHREVLEVLAQAKDGDGSLRSEQPAAATCCRVCGKGTPGIEGECTGGPLTREQWRAHSEHYAIQLERAGMNRLDAALQGEQAAGNFYGPCPEDS